MADPDYDTETYFADAANAAVIEYDAHFENALNGLPEPWVREFSWWRDGAKLRTRFHIPLHGAGYVPFKGVLPFRSLSRKFLDVTRHKYADGVSHDADAIEEGDFNGFAIQPAVMAANAPLFIEESAAALINVGETTMSWDGTYFLKASGKPVNVFKPSYGTWGNWYPATTLDATNLDIAIANQLGRLGANGKNLGLLGTHLWLSTALYEKGRRLVEVARRVGDNGADNPLLGRLKPVHCPQLHAKRWAVVTKKPGLEVFAVAVKDGGRPETIIHDKSSNLYKTKMQVGYNAVLRVGVGLAMPHAITAGAEA